MGNMKNLEVQEEKSGVLEENTNKFNDRTMIGKKKSLPNTRKNP